jgi:chromosome segregation ATPase
VGENIDEYAFLLEENLNAMALIEDEGKKWEKIEKEISQKQE